MSHMPQTRDLLTKGRRGKYGDVLELKNERCLSLVHLWFETALVEGLTQGTDLATGFLEGYHSSASLPSVCQ
jgi:hypothetical protein